ncbi:Uncharacterised protein [Vibrio cholerae]|nr:Uncharacterised protein [Vibrio cholerae]CSI79642.1 Uncharacterised protein [Vibrio cholerae]
MTILIKNRFVVHLHRMTEDHWIRDFHHGRFHVQ